MFQLLRRPCLEEELPLEGRLSPEGPPEPWRLCRPRCLLDPWPAASLEEEFGLQWALGMPTPSPESGAVQRTGRAMRMERWSRFLRERPAKVLHHEL